MDEARERDGKRSGQAENPKQSRRKPKQAKSSFSRKKKKKKLKDKVIIGQAELDFFLYCRSMQRELIN